MNSSQFLRVGRRLFDFSRRQQRQAARKSCVRQLFAEQLEERSLLAADLLSALLLGGAGDQRGTDLTIANGATYLIGNAPEAQSTAEAALVAKVSLPPSGTNVISTVWTNAWPKGNLFGAAAIGSDVYVAGWSFPGDGITSDSVGGGEVKAIVADFNAGTGAELYAKPVPDGFNVPSGATSFWNYSGVEYHRRVTPIDVGGTTYLFTAGGGQPNSYAAFVVAKYDLSGNLVTAQTDVPAGLTFVSGGLPLPGGSSAYDITGFGGSIFAAGGGGWTTANYGNDSENHPTLWKFDTNLGYVSMARATSVIGDFTGLETLDGKMYAVGSTWAGNSIVARFDATGGIEAFQVVDLGGADGLTDLVALNGKLYATGFSSSSGSNDIALVEIDPATLAMTSAVPWGGSNVDKGNAIATDGSNLYLSLIHI